MPRTKKIFVNRKRNLKRKRLPSTVEEPEPIPSTSTNPSSSSHASSAVSFSDDSSPKSSSSGDKVRSNLHEYDEFLGGRVFDFIDLQDFSEKLKEIAVCRECHQPIQLKVARRFGVALSLDISCVKCPSKSRYVNAVQKNYVVNQKSISAFDINVRMTYAFRAIGKGATPMKLFCGLMDIPTAAECYNKYCNILGVLAENVCSNSMKKAVVEAVSVNEGNPDLAVALDGSWQKRGYMSLNGLVTATSFDTGKVLDISILSKYCRCPDQSYHVDDCYRNYTGVSGGMEIEGAKEIFHRSLEKYAVRYKNYLGDGDSKAYKAVVDSKPYRDLEIQKLECVGHVQKRIGTRLRKLKTNRKGDKLRDGKGLGGKNRLTDAVIDKIQCYYGNAIRNNSNNLDGMKKSIWAIYYHLQASNEAPNHGLCDDSWCKYRQDPDSYNHDDHQHLSLILMYELHSIFQDLTNPSLLEKCLHGKTQNPNESVNHCIWTKIPKNVFVTLPKLRLGVFTAISEFNDGKISHCRVLKAAGIEPGFFCVKELRRSDKLRITRADRAGTAMEKKSRINLRRRRKHLEETFAKMERDDPSYAPGAN